MRNLNWIVAPQESPGPETTCLIVAEYSTTAYRRHYDQSLNVEIWFNPETQTFWRIVKEGSDGPTRTDYAHLR